MEFIHLFKQILLIFILTKLEIVKAVVRQFWPLITEQSQRPQTLQTSEKGRRWRCRSQETGRSQEIFRLRILSTVFLQSKDSLRACGKGSHGVGLQVMALLSGEDIGFILSLVIRFT